MGGWIGESEAGNTKAATPTATPSQIAPSFIPFECLIA